MMQTKYTSIGIIADNPLQRHTLQHAVISFGLQVGLNGTPSRLHSLQETELNTIDCWIIELDEHTPWPDYLDTFLEQQQKPILFGVGKAPAKHEKEYPIWERRLFVKLEEHLGQLKIFDSAAEIEALQDYQQACQSEVPLTTRFSVPQSTPPKQVWILAASLGGPEAVKRFLDRLPSGLPVAFLYAQHIDAHFANVLSGVLTRNSELMLSIAAQNQCLQSGCVKMIPVEQEFVFSDTGSFQFLDTPWPGPYGPSIDQVILNTINHYGIQTHAIIFSGMGNDGAIAAMKLNRMGCHVWAQSPESCASSAMPAAVIDQNCCSFVGSPEMLASHLVQTIEQELLPSSSLPKCQSGSNLNE